jgi:hypothetical protein
METAILFLVAFVVASVLTRMPLDRREPRQQVGAQHRPSRRIETIVKKESRRSTWIGVGATTFFFVASVVITVLHP